MKKVFVLCFVVFLGVLTESQDQPLTFSEPSYDVQLADRAVASTPVANVWVTNAQGEQVVYDLADRSVGGAKFTIDKRTGQIRLSERPSQWSMEELTLTVLATDNIHDPRRLASTTVNVQLVHSNQNRPRFPACDMYKPSVREESSVGTEVLKVAAIDEDSGEEGVIEYSIVQVPGATRSNFVIDANTGQIRTLRSFDRDEPVSERRLTLPIRATDKGRPPLDAICMITVEVQDINDNPPLFDQTRYEVNVPQDASVGSDWLRLAAMDHDEGLNSEVSFSLEHHERDGFFQVDNKTGVLKLIRPLSSVPVRTKFDFFGVARDSGAVPLQDRVPIHVVVTERQMKPPVWVTSEDSITVKEMHRDFKTPIGSFLAHSAHGDRKSIHYVIERGKSEQTNSETTFRTQVTNGRLYLLLSKFLDYERITKYELTLKALDPRNELSTTKAVTVYVEDENDNLPVIAEVNSISIHENQAPGQPIMKIPVTDADETEAFREVKWRWLNSNETDAHVFRLDETTGTIFTEQTLDRENISNYLLNVVAYNTAPAYDGTENYASLQILVKVEDVNDNPPFFIEPVGGYSAVIPEDTRNGSFVLELNAQDPDTTSDLFYSITSGNMDDTFTIDSRSGIIRVKKTLDFEETQKYDLVVEVSDSEWTASTSVEISVLNVNDLGPVFDRSVYDVQVKENMTQDELPFSLLQVHAVEPGTDESSSISYFLSDSDNEYFSVESKTGKIFVIKPIDYDPPIGRPNWDINIFAHNCLFPEQVNYAHLHLTLTDINDNAPVLNSALMKEPQILESSCNPCPLSESCFVTSLEVVDADGPKNGPPFSIEIEGNDTSGFILDHNGTLWTQDKEFDRETRKTVTLPIRITDSGIPPLSAVSNLLIVIGDCNDNILRDGSSTIFVFRYQDFLREGIIGRAFVEDADDWDLEDKNFFWKRDDGATPRISDPNFILQEQTGILTIKEGVPAGFYELRIGVYDKHWDATATATVNVVVVDLDEEALESSLVLKLEQCQPKEFLNKHEIFREVTGRLTGHRIEDVLVFGLRPENKFDDFCMLRFLVRNQENGFVSPLYLRWLLQTFGTKKFSEALGHPISEIRMHSSTCQASSPPQDCGTECEVSEDQVFGVSLIDSNRTSVVGLDIRRVSICQACLLLSEASQDASSVSLEDPESFAQFNIDQTSCFEQSVLAPSIKGHLFHAELISGDPQGVIAYKGPPLPLDHEAFKSSSSSFFMLDVSQDGRLRLQIGFQGSIHHLQSDASNSFSPESEHVVDISIVDRRLVLMIDDVIEAVANVQWEGRLHIAPGYPLHIGATPGGEIRARNNPLLRWNPRNSFVGCITNIQWNGRPLSTLRSASFFSESASRSCDSSLLLLQAHKGSATLRMSSVMWIPLAIAALLFIFLVIFMLILRRRRQERDTLSSKRKSGNFDGTLKRTTRVDEHLESSALDVNKDIELRPLISSGSRSRYQRLEHQPSVDDSVPNTTLTRLSGSLPRVTSMENFLQKRKHEADELEAVAGIEDLRCYAYEGDGSYVDSLSELDIDIDVESEDDSVDFMPPDLLKLRNPKLFGISHLLQ